MSDPKEDEPLRVALLGCGVVGSAVARLLTQHRDDLAARVGRPLDIAGIAVRRAGRDRSDLGLDPGLFTTDAEEVVTRADVVVEEVPKDLTHESAQELTARFFPVPRPRTASPASACRYAP